MSQVHDLPAGHQALHRTLVDRLVAELRPVRRLWPVGVRLALWVALEAAILIAVAIGAGRRDLALQLRDPLYLLEVGAFIAAAIVAGWLALRAAVPGREATRSELAAALLALALAAALVLGQPAQQDLSLAAFIRSGAACALHTGLLALLPWFALLWAVRRGTPLRAESAGGLIGAAALLFTFAVMRVGCPIDARLHLLVWHLLPALAGIGLSAVAGGLWLRRRPR